MKVFREKKSTIHDKNHFIRIRPAVIPNADPFARTNTNTHISVRFYPTINAENERGNSGVRHRTAKQRQTRAHHAHVAKVVAEHEQSGHFRPKAIKVDGVNEDVDRR